MRAQEGLEERVEREAADGNAARAPSTVTAISASAPSTNNATRRSMPRARAIGTAVLER